MSHNLGHNKPDRAWFRQVAMSQPWSLPRICVCISSVGQKKNKMVIFCNDGLQAATISRRHAVARYRFNGNMVLYLDCCQCHCGCYFKFFCTHRQIDKWQMMVSSAWPLCSIHELVDDSCQWWANLKSQIPFFLQISNLFRANLKSNPKCLLTCWL